MVILVLRSGVYDIMDLIKIAYQLGSLGHDDIWILDECLEEPVLCERDDPEDFAYTAEYLVEDVERHGVDHLFDYDAEDSVRASLGVCCSYEGLGCLEGGLLGLRGLG